MTGSGNTGITGRTRHALALAALLLLAFAENTPAEVFRYADRKGSTVFTDRPILKPGYTLIWRSKYGKVTKHSGKAIGAKTRFSKKHGWRNKKQFTPIITKVAKRTKLSPELLHAVIQAESAYNPKAKSHAGAMGLMQLMPATAERMGVSNVWDPKQNIEGGAKYLRLLLNMFRNNLSLALAAYNAGEGAVKKYGNKIPPYPETQNYVRKVIDYYRYERKHRNT